MEKILVNENKTVSDRQLAHLNGFLTAVKTELLPKFEAWRIGALTNELLSDMLHDCQLTSKLIEDSVKAEASKFNSPVISENLLIGLDEKIQEFKQHCSKFVQSQLVVNVLRGGLLLYIEVQSGEVCFIDDYENQLREANKYYIASEETQQLYNAFCELAKAFNNVRSKISPKVRESYSIRDLANKLDLINDKVVLDTNVDFEQMTGK